MANEKIRQMCANTRFSLQQLEGMDAISCVTRESSLTDAINAATHAELNKESNQRPLAPEKMLGMTNFDLQTWESCAIFGMKRERMVCPRVTTEGTAEPGYNIEESFYLNGLPIGKRQICKEQKSRAVQMCPIEAHSVSMLFSGAGVPPIGCFGVVPLFYCP